MTVKAKAKAPISPQRPATPQRRAALAKVHAARKDLALAEESYRDLVARVTGRRSAKDCTLAQLDAVVAEMKRLGWQPRKTQPARAGKRKIAPGEVQAKARALWLDLYHLGEVRDPAEAALDAFARRQVGVDSARFLTPQEAHRVIEALKDWAARAGVTWSPYYLAGEPRHAPKARVIEAQWARLYALGAVRLNDGAALSSWLHRVGCTPGLRDVAHLDDTAADQAIERLGRWIRSALGGVSDA